MGYQRKLEIYIEFESPYIVEYLEPLIGDLFMANFVGCDFDE